MLVLSRLCREEIVIIVPPSNTDQFIRVAVVGVMPNKCRLGIEAERSVVVHRSEVYEAILKEREQK